MRYFSTCLFFFLSAAILSGQVHYTGQVENLKGEALDNINILIYPANSEMLLAFDVTDEKGEFQVDVNIKGDSIDIQTSSIHYEKQRKRVANHTQHVSFKLAPDVKQLEAFTVRAAAIDRRGDTLSFMVSSFALEKDRSIEDVIRRMPGIEVEPGGTILYQGIPIQKFYVEGLDLMGGRYAIVSGNLPHGNVSTIEIMENHQPVRILEDRISSQQASLNIKLKRHVSITGQGNMGAGFAPLLWDANITPMMFTKSIQLLASYQANNTGKDVSKQMRVLTPEEFARMAERPSEKPGLLNQPTPGLPDFNENRYLDNNIHLVNLNGLIKLTQDLELRANLYFYNDYRQQESAIKRTFYTPGDSLVFEESIQGRENINYLQGEFTLSRNVKKNFLKNVLNVKGDWNNQHGLFVNDVEDVRQSLKKPFKAISNDLKSINPMRNHLIEFSSYISYDYSPFELSAKPGRFEDILYEGNTYPQSLQNVDLQRFYAKHAAGFVFNHGKITYTPRVGFSIRKQLLESALNVLTTDTLFNAGKAFANDLEGTQTRTYLQSGVEYRDGGFTLRASLPLSWQTIKMDDAIQEKGQFMERLFFDPGLSFALKFKGFWQINGGWSFNNRLGDMDGQNYGFILRDYRSLNQNATPISETQSHRWVSYLSYKNPITSFFSSFNYLFSNSRHNLIYSNAVYTDGSIVRQALLIPNTSIIHSVSAQASQFIRKMRMSIALKVSYSNQAGKAFVNDALYKTDNQFFQLNPSISMQPVQWLNLEYNVKLYYLQTAIEAMKSNDITTLTHQFVLYTLFREKHQFGFNLEYYDQPSNNAFFADLNYRYSIKKTKTDIELVWNNIFNVDKYVSYQTSSFALYETRFYLRPAQFYVKVGFRF
ncbi:MAG: hypothetical protein RBS33_04120 [Lentimicrobium sp.]|jgi:hypothetical protein|nr:hypothetical protein [Lentimicrobium sp.]